MESKKINFRKSFFSDNDAYDGSAICFLDYYLCKTKTDVEIYETNFTSSQVVLASNVGSLIAKINSGNNPYAYFCRTTVFSISIYSSYFYSLGPFSNNSYEDYSILKLFYTSLSISDTFFVDIDFTNGVGIILLIKSWAVFTNVTIENCSSLPTYYHRKHDSCIASGYDVPSSVIIVGEPSDVFSILYFLSCTFRNISSINSAGAAITIISYSRGTVILDCEFSHNSANEGAAIYAVGAAQLIVTKCNFQHNWAMVKGAAISLHSTFCSNIRESNFLNNIAFTGGAISIEDLDSEYKSDCWANSSTKISGSTFQMYSKVCQLSFLMKS